MIPNVWYSYVEGFPLVYTFYWLGFETHRGQCTSFDELMERFYFYQYRITIANQRLGYKRWVGDT